MSKEQMREHSDDAGLPGAPEPRPGDTPDDATGTPPPAPGRSATLTGFGPLDWGEPARPDPEAEAQRAAEWEATKARAKGADPGSLTRADRFARNIAIKEDRQAQQATAQGAAPMPKPRKPRAAKGKAADIEGAEKPARAPRKTAAKAAGISAGAQAAATVQATPEAIPPITGEAIAFLRNPDARAADLLALPPDSQAFVRYHITHMQQQEAAAQLAWSRLESATPRLSPAFEKVADAMLARVSKAAPVAAMPPAKPVAASYAPPAVPIASPAAVKVQLGKPAVAAVALAREDTIENSIEPGPALARAGGTEQAQPVAQPAPVATPVGNAAPSIGQRLLLGLGGVAQGAGTWLAARAKVAPVVVAAPAQAAISLAKPAIAAEPAPVMPEAVARRFLKVDNHYYFQDKTHAFTDRGAKLATRGHHPEVIRSLIEVAQARGWDSITVKGSDAFRRSAWMEAAQSGMKVAGYQPSALDLAELAHRPAANSVEKGAAQDLTNATPAKPAQVPAAALVTPVAAGIQWPDLPVKGASLPVASKPADPALTAKARAFETGKPTFVAKKYPELAGAIGLVEEARAFAAERLPAAEREVFVGLARRHVIQQIMAGQQVKGPQAYLGPVNAKDAGQAKEGQNQGKPARAKEVARER